MPPAGTRAKTRTLGCSSKKRAYVRPQDAARITGGARRRGVREMTTVIETRTLSKTIENLRHGHP